MADARISLRPFLTAVAATIALTAGLAVDARADEAPATSAATDLQRIEQATNELARGKRAAAAAIERLGAQRLDDLGACRRSGPGWRRIRRIRNASQRGMYVRAARTLHADMRDLVAERQARIEILAAAYERFADRLHAADVSDPLLHEAVAAQARRVASYRDVRGVGASCRAFNRVARRIRELPTRTPRQIIRADYRSGPLARRVERHISNQLHRIDRRHGIGYRDAETLSQAADRIVALGGSAGYATGFQYALSLR
ncbi:MAG: hypothetical protein WD399_04160 [Thermoleophilaceae bacterium]